MVGTLVLAVLAGARAMGVGVSPFVGLGLTILAAVVFGVYAIGDTRRSVNHLATTQAR